MNKVLTAVKSFAFAALVLAPGWASAEKLSKHKDSEGWEEWYWTKTVSVKTGEAHTFWITGLTESTAVDGLSVYCDYTYKEDGETYEDSIMASKSEEIRNSSGGYDQYVVLTTEDWENYYGSKSSLSFTVYVDGDGEDASTADISFNFGHTAGDVIPESYGTEDNPQPITVGTSIVSFNGNLIEGSYYFKATLEAGRKYKFYTSGGTADDSLSLAVSAAGEDMGEPETKDIDVGEYDQGFIVKPLSSGTHIICVDGTESQSFTLNYGGVPSRSPAAHDDVTDLKAISASGATTELELGHRNDPESGFFDNVIDQSLVKVSLAAGSMYHFKTEGATVNAVMEVYDAKGNVMLTNRGGVATRDCALTFKPAAKGDYYVGVCEDLEDDEEDEPQRETVTFSAKLVTLADGYSDEWDPEDDTYLGSTGLAPAIGTKDSDVLSDGASAGSHTLGVGDLEDWFRIDARKGLSYKFGAVLGEPYASAENLVLQAKVYTLNKGKLTAVAVTSDDDDLTKGLSFTATASMSYYIQVTVRDGQGIDFGPYEFKSLAYDASGAKLGTLTVNIGGATFAEGAVWWLGSEKTVTYPGGSSILLTEGAYTVNFATVKNWTAPTVQTVTVAFGTTATVDVKYSDTADHKDDVIAGATKLTPAAKAATVSRSLWKDDPADWFSFTVKPSGYYTFKLEPSVKLGDACICVYASDKTSLVAEGTSVSFLCRESKGDYYVCVKHNDSPVVDSQYVMTYSMVQVGTVGFAKTTVAVKDSATSVALTVNRANGKEGKVRVRYSTFAGTAEPGVNYINQSGILEWAENDTKAKTITIGLLGGLVPAWHEDLSFTVRLATLDPEDVAADEYVPMIGSEKATVTVSAATKKSTGTVQFCGFGALNEPLANLKKPTATVKSGEKACFWLERTGGSDGTVAVTVTPTKGKALPDVNYVDEPQTLVWADGETAAKRFVLETLVEDVELQSAKAMTLKLTADKTYADVAKLGAVATLTISDGKVSGTVEEYASTFAKTDGIAIKQAKADTWYFDEAGTLRSITPAAGAKAELTVTLTGPGKFAFTPTFVNTGSSANTATCTIGKETVSLAEGEEVVRYVAKGSMTVKFAVSRDKGDKTSGADCYLALDSGKADGSPFVWKQLKTPTLVAPLAGSLVDPLVDNHIEWSSVDETGDGDVIYRVWFDTEKNKAKLGTGDPLQESEDTSYCTGCGMVTPGYGESWVCRVDSAFVDEIGTVMLTAVNPSVWSYKTIPSKDTVCARIESGTDVDGNEIGGLAKVGNAYPVKLLQGVAVAIRLGAANASGTAACTYALASGSKLPDGLKLDAKTGLVTGAPTKVGECQTVIGVKQGTVSGGTEAFVFTVESAGLAAGTFNGLFMSDDDRLLWTEASEWSGLAAFRIGSFNFVSTEAGKLTAKLSVGGASYSFADNNGWDGKNLLDNGLAGVTNIFESEVSFTVGGKKVVCTNRLVVAACATTDGEEDVWAARDTTMKIELTLSQLAADKKSVVRDIVYTGTACRDNAKDAATLAELADWTGYYTVSLPCRGYAQYVQGYGYLTMTIDAKGKAKVTGVLADGTTKITASASVAYLSENDKGDREVRIPLYYGKGAVAFGGWLRMKISEAETPVVDSASEFLWINAATTASYEGTEGLSLEIEPTGGYYDTVLNLQTYYLDYAFRVNAVDTDDLPEELLGANEAYVCAPGLYGDYLTLLGSDVTMAKQAKVMRTDDKKLVDWEKTVNPSAFTMTFKRATGLYNGQFELWAGNAEAGEETKQVKIGTFKHQGILLLSRDESAGELAFEDGVMPGFWNATVSIEGEGTTKKRSFTASLPFVIAPEERENDWTEELPRVVETEE